MQAKERSQLEAQLAEAEQRLAAVQREREEHENRLSAATDSVEGAPFKGRDAAGFHRTVAQRWFLHKNRGTWTRDQKGETWCVFGKCNMPADGAGAAAWL